MNFIGNSSILGILFLGIINGLPFQIGFCPKVHNGGPSCSSGMDPRMYKCLNRSLGIITIQQKLWRKDQDTVFCTATYPFDLEMSGVTTQLMTENLHAEYRVKMSKNKIYYLIAISVVNLQAPRKYTFYKVGDTSVNTTFFVIRSGATAFPGVGQMVNVKSDREILTLPCIASDPDSNSTSLKLKKLVEKKETKNVSKKPQGMLLRTTRFQTITIVEDEYPQGGEFLTYDKTKGFLLNTNHFKNAHGVFSCVYSHSNNSEERFPITILPTQDYVVEPEQKEIIVFQNQKLHISCRSKQEVLLLVNFNGTVVNISSARSPFATHLQFQTEYILENTTSGDSGTISCVLKNDPKQEIQTWSIRSLDMWNNSQLNLSIEPKSVHCKSAEEAPKLMQISCSSESNCRHRLPCFLPGNSCPSSERVKYGSTCGSDPDKESCIELSAEDRITQGVIGCNAGNLTVWTHYIKAFDDKIYTDTDWRSAPVSAMVAMVVPKEKLYERGSFYFVCRFSTFLSNGDVLWYYKRKNDSQTFYQISAADNQSSRTSVKNKILLKFSMSHIGCSVPQWDAKGKLVLWNVTEAINVERREPPVAKNLGQGMKPIFVKGQPDRSISCAAHGLPQPNIEWFKPGTNLSREFTENTMNDGDNTVELKFPKIKEEHAGVYVCNASNSVGFVTQNFTVEVRGEKKPYFDNVTIEHIFFIGDNGQIECNVESYPRPVISWMYPSTLNKSAISPVATEDGLRTVSTIFLNSVSENFEGEYTCQAKNEFGNAIQNHVVKIEERSSPVTAMVVGACVAIVALFIPLIFVIWRLQIAKKEIRDLTAAEVEEFFKGNLNNAKREKEYNRYDDDPLEIQASLFSSLPYNKEYEIKKESLNIDESTRLGEGAFGMVLMANIKGMEDSVAVKTVKPNSEVSYFKALLSELKIMIYIGKHPNVVNLIGAYTENIKKRELYIAVELCQHGSLEKYLKGLSQKQLFQDEIICDDVSFPYADTQNTNPDILMQKVLQDGDMTKTSDLIRWSYQIANGMDYLASKKVIHADLSTRNVLLHQDGKVRITDFGLSRQLYDYTQYVKKNQAPLPWRWMAIESLRNMTFSTQSDVWAFGVTMWEMFSLGDIPYPGKSWTIDFVEELSHGLRMKKPRYATSPIYNIMVDCWEEEPQARPSFADLRTSLFLVAFGERPNIFD